MTTVFITGANRGIGYELAKQFSADPNTKVIATTRSLSKADDLKNLDRKNLHIISLDVGDSLEKVKADLKVLDKIAPEGVDVVIQNAGINYFSAVPDTAPATAGIEGYIKNFEINTVGSIKVYQAIYPYWIKKTGNLKRFLFISSGLGWINNYFGIQSFGYGMSKAAQNYFAKEAAHTHSQSSDETVKNSVTIAVHPGVVATNMASEWLNKKNSTDFLSSDEYGELLKKNKIENFLTAEQSATALKKLSDGLTTKDNGTFKNYTGDEILW